MNDRATEPTTDPVLAKRARIARLVSAGKRVGYGLFAFAVVGFFYGLVTSYTETLSAVIIGSLLVGSVILAPAIVFGYGVKAADRADRGLSDGH